MVFEDDALAVLRALTGLPAPAADRLRKRVTKHRTEAEALALAEEFLLACAANGVHRAVAAELWVQLAKFNQYSFCKSHAVSYGLIAWRAAYLKVHHPLPFWTAALNNNQGMYPRRVYVEAHLSRTEARFIVRDEGSGFDPGTLPDPRDPENLLKVSGRGVLIMRTFMDEVRFNSNGNEVTLVKLCAPLAAQR